jgi:polyisoprenyl-teichoic acid--peptidoglycan teichoic acid transferase
MNLGKSKKILLILVAVVMSVALVGCDKNPISGEATATLAPVEGQATQELKPGETPGPTSTPDPLAALRFWNVKPDKDIYHILLMGLDELDGTMYARNDTTMILQLNLKTNEMKLVSFMRDMWVDIPGQTMKYRLNNAYYRGGQATAIATMKSVFGIDVDYYAVVSFKTFEQVMKVVGPIKIQIMDYEVAHIKEVKSSVSVDGEKVEGYGEITKAGEYEVNAYQALSYGRDRHSSGEDGERAGDFGRNERQRQIVTAAWTKVKTLPTSAIIAGVLSTAGSFIDTDMPANLIITMVSQMAEADSQMQELAMPPRNKQHSLWIDREDGRNNEYTNDELEAYYQREKSEYENKGTGTPDPGDGAGDSEEPIEATPAPEKPPFPSKSAWIAERKFSNVIGWSSKSLYELHEFLGID